MPEPKDPNKRKTQPDQPDEPEEDARPVAVGDADWTEGEDEAGAARQITDIDFDRLDLGDPSGSATPAGIEGFEPDAAVERPGAEAATGVACLALALSTLLPWYGAGNAEVSGFSSGTFGPIIFFLGIAGALIVLLRRFKVPIAFPLEHGLILEGIGWLSVAGLIFKRYRRPKIGTFEIALSEPYFLWIFGGLMIALLCAVMVALLGGRLSTGSPFMLRPGWKEGFAGKVGIGLLALSLLLGVSFGYFNEEAGLSARSPEAPKTTTYKGKAPPCLKLPVPSGIKKTVGKETEFQDNLATCTLDFTSTRSLKRTSASFVAAFKKARLDYKKQDVGSRGATYTITKPCGLVNMSKVSKGKVTGTITQFLQSCPFANLPPTPGAS